MVTLNIQTAMFNVIMFLVPLVQTLSMYLCPMLNWRSTILIQQYSTNFSMFKVNNRSTIKRWEICSNLTIKTLERRHWHSSCVFLLALDLLYTFFKSFYCCFWACFFFAGYKKTLEQKVPLKVNMFKVNNTDIRMAMVMFCQSHFHRLQKYLSRCLLVQIQEWNH